MLLAANSQISDLYIRKSNHETERRIFPYLVIEDLRHEIIDHARKVTRR
jgi:hypothetical protein